uniref:IPPc domain-containing protein n=1 Tax=Bursaphelenchus xylophilus TaxID=6326 RepID=A0A1I7SUC0_BURXY
MKWRLGAVTFNLCGKPAQTEKVKQLIDDLISRHEIPLDGIAISLQEVNMAERTNVSPDAWKEKFHELLWERGYIYAASSYMMTNFLAFFVLKEYGKMIAKSTFEYIKDRYYGVKGSICLSVDLKDNIRFIFVGSHLLHGPEAVDRRVIQAKSVKDYVSKQLENKVVGAILWLGDFNFRITGVGAVEFVQTLRSDEFIAGEVLQKHDQLTEARFFYDIFDTWSEADITFKPTYRFHIGSLQYDMNRVPAWTDRILFNKLSCLHYDSMTNINISDHIPVFGIFETPELDVLEEADWEIKFDPIDYWYINLPLRVLFKGANFWQKAGSVWDWLGVYKVPDCSDRRFVTQASIMSAVETGNTYQVEFVPLPVGDYFVAYHSYNRGCIQGMTNVFSIKEI